MCMAASGMPGRRCLVVGEAPGRNEDEKGKPFIGRAGTILDTALNAVFGEEARAVIPVTNVCKCRPPSNRKPTPEEVGICTTLYLTKEIERFDPLSILALGNTAVEALLGMTGISSLRGEWFPLDSEEPRWVMPTWHPAYVDRDRTARMPEFLSDVRAFAKRVGGTYG